MIHEFTTAAIDLTATAELLEVLSTKLQTETLTFHTDNYEIFPFQVKAAATPDTEVVVLMKGPDANEKYLTTYWFQDDIGMKSQRFSPERIAPSFTFM